MTILCYHAVQPGWSSPMAVDPATLDQHLGWLVRHRTVVPLREAVTRLDARWRLPPGQVALTFDDGFRGLHEHALPLLRRYGVPATVFLVTATLTHPGHAVDWVDEPRPQRLDTLTLEQVQEMAESGIDFESHTHRHLDLTRLSFDEVLRDLRESRQLLGSVLGREVSLLAYPRGRHNTAVRAACDRAGYTHAFTLPERREPVGPFAVPRVGIFGGNGLRHLRAKTARGYLGVRTSAPYSMVRELRRPAARVPS
jgi:peptidoglycan/xylan/chitin deacetylase (PgdA/CDA1 family)